MKCVPIYLRSRLIILFAIDEDVDALDLMPFPTF